ncbi:MAG: VOC family protein, partial [Microvirga sp.]
TGFAAFSIAYNARSKEEADDVYARAVQAGARAVKPLQDVFWGGYSGYFTDPDNHLWEVAWNPNFPIDGDGHLFLPDSAP